VRDGRDKPDFWIGAGAASYHQRPVQLAPITPVRVVFAARSPADVEAVVHA
jgi:hypothetical protein